MKPEECFAYYTFSYYSHDDSARTEVSFGDGLRIEEVVEHFKRFLYAVQFTPELIDRIIFSEPEDEPLVQMLRVNKDGGQIVYYDKEGNEVDQSRQEEEK